MADIIVQSGRTFYEVDGTLAAVLVEVGLANYKRPTVQVNLAPPPEGWAVVRGGQLGDKLLLRYHDGRGGTQTYDAPPKSRLVRKWVHDPSTPDLDGHYELIEAMPPIPAAVLAEWHAAGGGPSDPDAAVEAYRKTLDKVDAQLASQNQLANTFLRVQGGRK